MTYAEYVATLTALTVAGVTKRYSAPPAQLSTAQLPAMWARLPSGTVEVVAMDGGAGLPSFTCDLVIAIEAMGQNTQPANYAKALAVIDAMQTTLTTEALNSDLDSWQMRVDVDQVGDTAYWVIVATVTGSE